MIRISFFVLAACIVATPAVAANKRAKTAYDPNKMVCKIEQDTVSRFAKRKVCRTVAEWDEVKRIERLHLMQNQRNGAQ